MSCSDERAHGVRREAELLCGLSDRDAGAPAHQPHELELRSGQQRQLRRTAAVAPARAADPRGLRDQRVGDRVLVYAGGDGHRLNNTSVTELIVRRRTGSTKTTKAASTPQGLQGWPRQLTVAAPTYRLFAKNIKL